MSALQRTGGKIGICRIPFRPLDMPPGPHLPPKRFPVHDKGGFPAVIQFTGLCTCIICVEYETVVFDASEQHHSDIWHSGAIDRCQGNCVRIIGFNLTRFVQPPEQDRKWFTARKFSNPTFQRIFSQPSACRPEQPAIEERARFT